MNPFLSRELAGEHIRDLHEDATRAGRARDDKPAGQSARDAGVTVRGFAERDIDGIRLLAALDGKQVPLGSILVAEQAGELLAALPLDGAPALADPFKPTADVVALLRLRAQQLREPAPKRGTRLRLPGRLHLARRKFA